MFLCCNQSDQVSHCLAPDDPPKEPEYNYTHMMLRDERRFRVADRNGDLVADKQEFSAFLHPEEHEYMKDVVVQVRLMPWGHVTHCFVSNI